MTLREALSAMCYREIKPGKWFKPVGNILFVFEEENRTWTNWYRPANSPEEIWCSHTLDVAAVDYARQLKSWEMNSRIDRFYGEDGKFELQPLSTYLMEPR